MSENRTSFEDYLNSSHDEVANAKASSTQKYVFNNQEKTVLAEYTFKGRKYVVTDSFDQNGKSKTEIFIVGAENSLTIPEADDPYYGILTSISNAQIPHDVVMDLKTNMQQQKQEDLEK